MRNTTASPHYGLLGGAFGFQGFWLCRVVRALELWVVGVFRDSASQVLPGVYFRVPGFRVEKGLGLNRI